MPCDRDYSPGLSVVFSFRAILPWGFIFSEVGPLVLPQLTITISFYDLLIVYAIVLGLMNFVVVAHRDVVSRPGLGLETFRDQIFMVSVSVSWAQVSVSDSVSWGQVSVSVSWVQVSLTSLLQSNLHIGYLALEVFTCIVKIYK